jgi:hypothetical protein
MHAFIYQSDVNHRRRLATDQTHSHSETLHLILSLRYLTRFPHDSAAKITNYRHKYAQARSAQQLHRIRRTRLGSKARREKQAISIMASVESELR